jgi:hypothetical protein
MNNSTRKKLTNRGISLINKQDNNTYKDSLMKKLLMMESLAEIKIKNKYKRNNKKANKKTDNLNIKSRKIMSQWILA